MFFVFLFFPIVVPCIPYSQGVLLCPSNKIFTYILQAVLSRNLGNAFGTSIWKTDPQDRNIQLDCPLMEGIRAHTTGGK